MDEETVILNPGEGPSFMEDLAKAVTVFTPGSMAVATTSARSCWMVFVPSMIRMRLAWVMVRG